ncbi:MAG: AI-2E family transporter, partial [bacterium]|nr:AI-2E family transporter [bacterium]
IAILLIGVFLYLIRDIMVAVLFSVVIASGVEPAAVWFKKRRVPRVFAVIFVYLAAFAFIGAMFYLIIPTIFREVTNFAGNLPNYLEDPLQFEFIARVFPNLPDFATGAMGQFIGKVSDFVGGLSAGALSLASAAFGGAVSLVLIVVLSFYLSVQENGIEKFLGIVVPSRHEKYAISLWMRWRKKIGLWLQGQVLLGFIVGVLVYMGLTILQVEYALTFALLAALFELIPIFGPILAAVPPIMVALLQSPLLAGEVAVLYIIIQQFENHLIYPLVVTKIVGVPPMIVILSLIIGAQVGGLFGIILAIPLATLVIEVLEDIDVRKKHQIKELSGVENKNSA